MGVTLGSVLANVFGGPIAQMQGADVGNWVIGIGFGWLLGHLDWANIEGWRIAFVVVGLPGVLVAMLVRASIKEPPRGYPIPPRKSADTVPDWRATFAGVETKAVVLVDGDCSITGCLRGIRTHQFSGAFFTARAWTEREKLPYNSARRRLCWRQSAPSSVATSQSARLRASLRWPGCRLWVSPWQCPPTRRLSSPKI